jgi:hypothetical protein
MAFHVARSGSGKPRLAGVLDDATALSQGYHFARPALAGSLIGRPRYDQVFDAGDVLHEGLAGDVSTVDAVGETWSFPILRFLRRPRPIGRVHLRRIGA